MRKITKNLSQDLEKVDRIILTQESVEQRALVKLTFSLAVSSSENLDFLYDRRSFLSQLASKVSRLDIYCFTR
jgi:hypothetical protein